MAEDTPTPEAQGFPAWSIQIENDRLRELVQQHEQALAAGEGAAAREAEIATLREELERERQTSQGNYIAATAHAETVEAANAEIATLRQEKDLADEMHNRAMQMYSSAQAEIATLRQELHESNAVCSCGCPISEHENHGEDGEACEHDDHECVRTSKAVYSMLATLRQERDALVVRIDQLEADVVWASDKVEAAEAENARLRAALLTEEQLAGLRQYVDWHGAAHDHDCPADDTCECSMKSANAAVNSLLAPPAETDQKEPE